MLIKWFLIYSAAFFWPAFAVSLPSKESEANTLKSLNKSCLLIKFEYLIACSWFDSMILLVKTEQPEKIKIKIR